jgi:hypothetical protein
MEPAVETAEDLIKAAKQHGLQSEPEHEVGDLQEMVRASWRLMTNNQREDLLEVFADLKEWLT